MKFFSFLILLTALIQSCAYVPPKNLEAESQELKEQKIRRAELLLGTIATPKEDTGAFGPSSETAKKSASLRIKDSLLQETHDYLRGQLKESPLLKLNRGSTVTILFKNEVRF